MKLAAMPAASTRYVGWNAEWSNSTPRSPMAKSSTHTSISDDTTSRTPDSRSTTSVIPSGAGQPPPCVTTTPSSSARINSAIEAPTTVSRATPLIARWTVRERAKTTDSPAASSGARIGSGINAFTFVPFVVAGRPLIVHRVGLDVVHIVVVGGVGRVLEVGELGVGEVRVGAAAGGDEAVLDVVGDQVVVRELPTPVGHRQQEGGDTERDHDRRQGQGLRQRVAELGLLALPDQRRDPTLATGRDQQDVGPVADQAEPDDDPRQAPLEEQPRADAEQTPRP